LIDIDFFNTVLTEPVDSVDLLTKGQIGDIYKLQTETQSYILKTSQSSPMLLTEAEMLRDINKYKIPVPQVFDVGKKHLLMEYIEEEPRSRDAMETEAAKMLSKLHSVTNESRMYGYYYDTSIGPFRQFNEQTQYNWGLFLGQMRILPMAKICYEKGEIDRKTVERLEHLCRDLYNRIDMSTIVPSLLHGDLWSGNILFNINGAVLIDPAIYFGDREMELAFILLFDTFGDTFFNTYTEVYPLSDDFYDTKVPLYQLYPLLVHVALYGSSYSGALQRTMEKLKI
jgi:fructosamine-3-kinase